MLSNRLNNQVPDNPLHISWHDTNWIPILNTQNVMDYFSDKSNPFYDRQCNNETLRMQRQAMENLNNMTGLEYVLLHVQEPILYVVRKQHRHNPESATPVADYYIIAGIVYQAPNLENVFSSRVLSTVGHLLSAFEEASSFSRYHPNKGYTWDFSKNSTGEKKKEKKEEKTKEEPSSLFQRQRVDMLLVDFLRKFPPPSVQTAPSADQGAQGGTGGVVIKTEVKQEEDADGRSEKSSDMRPPPEKKMKM